MCFVARGSRIIINFDRSSRLEQFRFSRTSYFSRILHAYTSTRWGSSFSAIRRSHSIMSSTVSTRILIISDTHNYQFDEASKYPNGTFIRPIPKVDILLHCGDLTSVGGNVSYKKCLEMLSQIPAELKLVIAGNHDLTLDPVYFRTHLDEEDDPEEHVQALEFMKGELAKEAGVTYLEEGVHAFSLKNGAKFKVYASPYQPEFCGWAFAYERNQDRWNTQEQVKPGPFPVRSIAENPIPDFGKDGVDIIMTHGPPMGILDLPFDGMSVGCENLLRAVSRARPRLHCFGHIHEGHGAKMITWEEDKGVFGWEAIERQEDEKNVYPEVSNHEVAFGRQTLMVNAAIMDLSYRPRNAPWLIDLDLPKGA